MECERVGEAVGVPEAHALLFSLQLQFKSTVLNLKCYLF